jgi:thioredoxin reductase (NADPH)
MRKFDLFIIGAGAAGLTAAMYAARYGLNVAVVDSSGAGGQISTAELIENFPGFPNGIAGHELGPLLHAQAEAAGVEFFIDTIERIAVIDDEFHLHGTSEALQARSLIVAAGSARRSLGIPGEREFLGKGVSHCASCDGPLFAGQEVAVIGGGDSALDEALTLAAHASRVTIIHRGASFSAQHILAQRVAATGSISILFDTVVEEIVGERAVTGVRLRDGATGAVRIAPLRGAFIYAGLEPNTHFLRGLVTLDSSGRIETDVMMATSHPGIFAAGDIRSRSVAQLAAAAGDGATAAIAAFRYLATRPIGAGLKPVPTKSSPSIAR